MHRELLNERRRLERDSAALIDAAEADGCHVLPERRNGVVNAMLDDIREIDRRRRAFENLSDDATELRKRLRRDYRDISCRPSELFLYARILPRVRELVGHPSDLGVSHPDYEDALVSYLMADKKPTNAGELQSLILAIATIKEDSRNGR